LATTWRPRYWAAARSRHRSGSAPAVFGGEGTREIVYLVGHYCFISMTLNGFAISVPDDK
jgi:hypothetical protein